MDRFLSNHDLGPFLAKLCDPLRWGFNQDGATGNRIDHLQAGGDCQGGEVARRRIAATIEEHVAHGRVYTTAGSGSP